MYIIDEAICYMKNDFWDLLISKLIFYSHGLKLKAYGFGVRGKRERFIY